MFTCAGGFDCGVECKQIGLLGNGTDCIGNLADLFGTRGELTNNFRRFRDGGGNSFHLRDGSRNGDAPCLRNARNVVGGLRRLLGKFFKGDNVLIHVVNFGDGRIDLLALIGHVEGDVAYRVGNLLSGKRGLVGVGSKLFGEIHKIFRR